MRNRTLLAFSLLTASSVLAGCSSQSLSSTDPTAAPSDVPDLSTVSFTDESGKDAVQVDAADNVFKPEYIEITAGTEVTFRNDGRNDHNVIPTGANFEAIQADRCEPGTEQTITFATPGDYPYYCSLHGTKTKGMIGAIRVK
jgi:plastocyanin